MSRRIRIVIGVLCFLVGFLVAYDLNNGPSSPPESIPTLQTTVVTVPTAPPEGWLRFEGKGVAMYLPDSFIGGSIEDLSEELQNNIEKELPEAASLMQEFLQNPEKVTFFAYDQVNASSLSTNVNVVKSRFSNERYPLQDILDAVIKQYPESFEVLESGIVAINNIEVIRVGANIHLQTYTSRLLQYIRIDENNDAWMVAYTTSPDEYDERLPIFERSYQSFELLPP